MRNEDGDGGKYKFSWWSEECVSTRKCWNWRGKWRDALMWKVFLKQTYLFSVFRMMSKDGGGGRSKVLWGWGEWINSILCRYKKFLKIERYTSWAWTAKMDVVEKEVVYFWKDERECCQSHEWMRTANFFLVVYAGISRKMERWWKYLKHIFCL